MAIKITHAGHGDESDEFWLITYSDMVTLLLTFFLLIFSFSVMDEDEGRSLVGELNEVTTAKTAGGGVKSKAELETAAREIAAQFKKEDTFVEATEEEVTVGLSSAVTFASGDAALTESARAPLEKVADILVKMPNTIRIEGHTDDVPMKSGKYPSNWHLSAARAQSVVRLLMEKGVDPKRMQNVGYGETRARHANDTPEHRAANRRIEIKIIRDAAERKAAAPAAGAAAPAP